MNSLFNKNNSNNIISQLSLHSKLDNPLHNLEEYFIDTFSKNVKKLTYILQKSHSYEYLTIKKLSMLFDFKIKIVQYNGDKILSLQDKDIEQEISLLIKEGATPIGSVEFIKHIFSILNIPYKSIDNGFFALKNYLHRNIQQMTLNDFYKLVLDTQLNEQPNQYSPYFNTHNNYSNQHNNYSNLILNGEVFIKPLDIKLFSGFIYRLDNQYCTDYDKEQASILSNLLTTSQIIVSNPISIKTEYRAYILDNNVVGLARYDNNEEDIEIKHLYDTIQSMCNDYIAYLKIKNRAIPVAFSLDVAITEDNQITYIENNDAWALGLYKCNIKEIDYLLMLTKRWQQIIS